MNELPVVFVDVDTQFDFMMPEGKLYIPGAETIIGKLERLTQYARDSLIPILATTDTHEKDDDEFSQFPPHCVEGTPGQRKITATCLADDQVFLSGETLDAAVTAVRERQAPIQLIVPKPTLNIFDNPLFGRLIEQITPSRFIVYGVATDYCVLIAAMGLIEKGCQVAIVQDAIRAVDVEAGAEAIRKMADAGAQMCEIKDVTG